MPITQTRMITLINAALDYQQALDKLSLAISQGLQAAQQGHIQPLEVLEGLFLTSSNRAIHLMRDEAIAHSTIATERAHFASQMRRNESARRWQEKQRRLNGVRPREDSTGYELFLPATPRQYPVQQFAQSVTQNRPELSGNEFDPDFEQDNADLDIDIGNQRHRSTERGTSSSPLRIETGNRSLQRKIEIETSPPGHSTTVRAADTFENDLLVCACGFEGSFETWQQHLAGAGEGREQK